MVSAGSSTTFGHSVINWKSVFRAHRQIVLQLEYQVDGGRFDHIPHLDTRTAASEITILRPT